MTSSLIEMMLLKEIIGSQDNDFTKKYEDFNTWLKERDKKAKTIAPATFSPGQVFLFVLGLGPIMGMGGWIAWMHITQYALDLARTLH